jgi:hypothetical protein
MLIQRLLISFTLTNKADDMHRALSTLPQTRQYFHRVLGWLAPVEVEPERVSAYDNGPGKTLCGFGGAQASALSLV